VAVLVGLVRASEDDPLPPAWPLLACALSAAAHDTTVLRALLGMGPRPVPYLPTLLQSSHETLVTGGPGLVAAVRDALEDHGAAAHPAGALALLDALAEPDETVDRLSSRHPYPLLADAMCVLLPAVADAAATQASADVGSEEWVQARDDALHTLLSGK
jgi:hypothetical protein